MLKQAIKDLMIKKYDNYKVYIHNMARFDGIFLLKILVDLGHCQPLIHNDEIISIQFNYNDYVIHFRDSQQLLIRSLRDLAKAFGVETQKTIFPYTFVNENNLDYIGEVPNYNYFDKVSSSDYNNYCENFKNNWDLKNETIKYCGIDSICLYQVITLFNTKIFDLFNINIHKHPTLSSLAFGIFRCHFLRDDLIPQLSGQIAKDIRQSYTGGAVDLYIPENPEGVEINIGAIRGWMPVERRWI
jgi:DNA polymerase type B, organellar and viral